MMAGFRLLSKDAAGGRWLIRYRDRSLFEEYGNDRWRTMASYATREERDQMFERLLQDDVWTVEASFAGPEPVDNFEASKKWM